MHEIEKEDPTDPFRKLNKTRKVMKTVTDQGERIAGVMEKLQAAQTKKMDMMTKIYGSHA